MANHSNSNQSNAPSATPSTLHGQHQPPSSSSMIESSRQNPCSSLSDSLCQHTNRQEIMRRFEMVDTDQHGLIDERQLQEALSGNYHKLTAATVRSLIAMFKNYHDPPKIGRNEFLALWRYLGQLQAIYEGFDRGTSGNIDPMELRNALCSLGYDVPDSFLQVVSKYDDGGTEFSLESFIECAMTVKRLASPTKLKSSNRLQLRKNIKKRVAKDYFTRRGLRRRGWMEVVASHCFPRPRRVRHALNKFRCNKCGTCIARSIYVEHRAIQIENLEQLYLVCHEKVHCRLDDKEIQLKNNGVKCNIRTIYCSKCHTEIGFYHVGDGHHPFIRSDLVRNSVDMAVSSSSSSDTSSPMDAEMASSASPSNLGNNSSDLAASSSSNIDVSSPMDAEMALSASPSYPYVPSPGGSGGNFPPGTHPEIVRNFQTADKEKSSMHVAEQCAWALGNVAGEGEELRISLLSQGALTPLARMMLSNKGSTVRTAAWALSNLIKGPDVKGATELIKVDGVLDAILRHLKTGDEDLATEVAWVVVYLSALSNIATTMLIKSDIVQILVGRLATSNNIQLHIPVLRGLGNLVAGDSQKAYVVAAGHDITGNILFALVKCLRSDHRVLKKEASWVLSNIAADSLAHKQLIFSSEAVPLLLHLLATAPFDIRKEVAYALGNLCVTPSEDTGKPNIIVDHLVSLVSRGCLPGFVNLVRSADIEAARLGLQFLELVMRGMPNREGPKLVEKEDGIDAMEKFQFHENEDLRNMANGLVDKYFGEDYGLEE